VIKLDWTIWIQFANFFFLIFILNVLLYRPYRALMDRRRGTIEGSLSRARDLETQIEEKMARYQEQLQQAKLKGNQEKAEMRRLAAAEETKMISAAREEATEQLTRIKGQVATEAADAREKLKKEARILGDRIAVKVLGRELTS